MEDIEAFARDELNGLHLGHERRNARARRILSALAMRPRGFVTEVFRTHAEQKAGYRFLGHAAFGWRDLGEPMHEAAARRCAAHRLVVGVIDGSSVAHTDTQNDDGVGPIGSLKSGGRGLKLMSLVLFDTDGVPLGIGSHELWARPEAGAVIPHHNRALEDKESRHWTSMQSAFLRTCERLGVETKVWMQLDAEADSNEVLMFACNPRTYLTVRSRHDRILFAQSPEDRSMMHLSGALASAPRCATIHVRLRATRTRKGRVAKVEIRAVSITARLRAQWSHKRIADVFVNAVMAREIDAPPDAEPIEWVLLTTYPVGNGNDAALVVRSYALRWGIETIHYTVKSGRNRVEDSQLESFGALAKWATLHLSAAVQAQAILMKSRSEPDLPADVIFEREIIDAALLLYQSHRRDAPKPGSTPTLEQMVFIIASLGGYTGNRSAGPPGIKTFSRGMDDVEVAARAVKLLRAQPPSD